MENFLSRHEAYVRSALPLAECYRQRSLLCTCDASGPRDEVTEKLLAALSALFGSVS